MRPRTKAGYTTSPFGFGPLGPTMLLVPAFMFFLLWPNWGTTLYGEVRGASDFRRVFSGMFAGLWITVILTVVFLLLVAKTIGWDFYQNLNALDYNLTPHVRHLALPVHVRGLAGAQHGVPGRR